MSPWRARLDGLPEGYSFGVYRGRRYGMRKTVFAGGRSLKFYAEELGGTDFVSLNVYFTQAGPRLKPCEMPAARVIDFLETVRLTEGDERDDDDKD